MDPKRNPVDRNDVSSFKLLSVSMTVFASGTHYRYRSHLGKDLFLNGSLPFFRDMNSAS
jgi:hypothetical protein